LQWKLEQNTCATKTHIGDSRLEWKKSHYKFPYWVWLKLGVTELEQPWPCQHYNDIGGGLYMLKC
jgi:hypothetical protein